MYPTPFLHSNPERYPGELMDKWTTGILLALPVFLVGAGTGFMLGRYLAHAAWRSHFGISGSEQGGVVSPISITFTRPPLAGEPAKDFVIGEMPAKQGETSRQAMDRTWQWVKEIPKTPT